MSGISGGGWPAIRYALRMARQAGGFLRFYGAMRSGNACKTCALGMGGQRGGMVDEAGHFPEVCKKSMQAMAADMQGRIALEFFRRYGFDALRTFGPRELEMMGRLVEPVLAGPGEPGYRPIGWEDAFAWCAEKFRHIPPEQHFFYASGRSSNEAGFLFQLFARRLGTNNVSNCSYYCHQASGVGLSSTIGTTTATIALEDLQRCDLLFLIGGNPASNHPRLMRTLVQLRRRGGRVIVINPMREAGLMRFSVPSDIRSLLFGSEIASSYLMPHIGGDIALLLAIARRVEELGAVDEGFVRNCTEDWSDFRQYLHSLDWETLVRNSGVSSEQIEEAATAYARSQHTVFAWTMGITHHLHGADNVRAIVNLALLRGMVGKPGAGLLPIRGHSNVQGLGSIGVVPSLKPGVQARMEEYFGVSFPKSSGMDTLASLQAADEGRVRAGWCLGGNLFGASPDARQAARAFGRLDAVCYLSTTLNTGHAWGRARETLILPVLVRDEEPQPTTQESMFSFVRFSAGGPRRHEGPRSEVEILAQLAADALGHTDAIDWSALGNHRALRQAIAACIPGYESIAALDEGGSEFHVEGRVMHRGVFPRPHGRAAFALVPIPDVPSAFRSPTGECKEAGDDGGLTLMTIRSEGQFNTVVYEEEDLYRGQDRRNVILMNPWDIQRRGLTIDQRVVVRSPCGTLRGILVRAFDIRVGAAAMYLPEANVLVPGQTDPESHTPAFKSVRITVEPDVDKPSVVVTLRMPSHTAQAAAADGV